VISEKVVKSVATVELSFPLFRKSEDGDDGWSTEAITRIDRVVGDRADGTPKLRETEVKKHHSFVADTVEWTLEIDERGHFDKRGGQDWNYCLGEHKATAAEFLALLAEMEKALATAREGVG
jgi:hypothetical protein